MDSVLLAQLAADKKLSRFTKPEDWYSSYANVLGELAWQITAFRTEQYVPPGSAFTLEDVVLNLLQGIVTSHEVDLVRETIRTFNKLPDEDPRVLVYERFSHCSSVVDLQVGVTDRSSVLSALGVVIETEQEVQGLFTQEFLVAELVGKVRTLSYSGTLNEKAYAPLRSAVITKLGSKRSELILDLDLP